MYRSPASTRRAIRNIALSIPVCAVLSLGSGAPAAAEIQNSSSPASEVSVKVRTAATPPDLTDYDLSAGTEPALALAGIGIITLSAGGAFAVFVARRR